MGEGWGVKNIVCKRDRMRSLGIGMWLFGLSLGDLGIVLGCWGWGWSLVRWLGESLLLGSLLLITWWCDTPKEPCLPQNDRIFLGSYCIGIASALCLHTLTPPPILKIKMSTIEFTIVLFVILAYILASLWQMSCFNYKPFHTPLIYRCQLPEECRPH